VKAYQDPNHEGNRIRPNLRCLGCGKMGCITAWGQWCFECNVERLNRIDKKFDPLRRVFGKSA
jgi:hypothetical protein